MLATADEALSHVRLTQALSPRINQPNPIAEDYCATWMLSSVTTTASAIARLLAEEGRDRLLMLGRGVADRLRLGAERGHLLAAELERLVEDGLAEPEMKASMQKLGIEATTGSP